MRRRKSKPHKDSLKAVQLSIAKARLAKLEGEIAPPETPEYTHYEDLPPLPPEEREHLKQKFIDLLTVSQEEQEREKYEWYMSMAHWAP